MVWNWAKTQSAIMFVQTVLNSDASGPARSKGLQFYSQNEHEKCEVFTRHQFFAISSRQDG
jgi:hypothetical protein